MLSSLAEYKIPSILSATNLISLNIIVTSLGIAKQTQKLILLDSRQNKENYISTHSNAWTVMVSGVQYEVHI